MKAKNFSRNPNKLKYAYLLTPEGIQEKVRITRRFLERKIAEYKALEEEIAELASEVSASDEVMDVTD